MHARAQQCLRGAVVAVMLLAWLGLPPPMGAQRRREPSMRTPDGKPNLNGIWQALNTANWDIQDHSAQAGPPHFGALFSMPAGQGIVVGNEIPYKASALAGC